MTSGRRRLTRRALFVGAGVATAYGVVRLTEDSGGSRSGAPGPTPTSSPAPGATGEPVDLTVRWRHLEQSAALPGLVAGWQFDDGAGYEFADVTGSGHTLFITGTEWNTSDSGLASAIHRPGLRGGAVHLDGSRWLAADLADDLAPTAGLTVSCRLRPDVLPDQAAVVVGYGGVYLLSIGPPGSLVFTLTDAAGARHAVHAPGHPVQPGAWSQVTATVSPRTGALHLYVNGEPLAHAVSRPFTLGATPAHLVLGRHLTGSLDEAAVHDVALGADDVRHLHVVGLPKVYTQTSESIDPKRTVLTRFKGSDPVPHPVVEGTVLTHRFANGTTTQQGVTPLPPVPDAVFAPGAFGGAWRATAQRLSYQSPLVGDSGTFEAWYRPVTDPADPRRKLRKEVFHATGTSSALTLYTKEGRWQVDIRRQAGPVVTRSGPPQVLTPGSLEHIAVTWGRQPAGAQAVALYVNGAPAAFLETLPGDTTYGERVGLGGTAAAPAYCLFDDVRISDTALGWGDVCPRGQAATGDAGLDLRDTFDRPAGAAAMLWRAGSDSAAWSHRQSGLFQRSPVGLHPSFHPDAYGYASSIEAGVAVPTALDGWAGLFVQSPQVGGEFSGVTFMLNPLLGALRLARYDGGRVAVAKVLPHDFPVAVGTTYEMTLTCAGDGIVRGFIDGANVISMRAAAGWPGQGYAGMVTDGSAALFSNLHFCALTPSTPTSRVVATRVIRYGDGTGFAALDLVPFRWQKRRGVLPWEYTTKDPEAAGNIAGADTALPPRPIGPAAWRSEDSANSDLITVNGRVLYFMRGNPRIDGRPAAARIGVLHAEVASFDAVHFTDPNAAAGNVQGGTLLLSDASSGAVSPPQSGVLQLNAPSTAYVGGGKLLFLGRVSSQPGAGEIRRGQVVYSRFDVLTDSWEDPEPRPMAWSSPYPPSSDQPVERSQLSGSPEVVSLRDPDHDTYQAVVFQQTGGPGRAVMATAMLSDVSTGTPALMPGLPVQTSLARPSGGAIYGFRVMFDNGIYYLHYNEGPQVPDWPERFVLAATLDPYAGPWVTNPASMPPGSTYFRRGSVLEPDNAAIWQGTMFKHRGHYYLYYENYHSIAQVNVPYQHYGDPQVGSRVGFATA